MVIYTKDIHGFWSKYIFELRFKYYLTFTLTRSTISRESRMPFNRNTKDYFYQSRFRKCGKLFIFTIVRIDPSRNFYTKNKYKASPISVFCFVSPSFDVKRSRHAWKRVHNASIEKLLKAPFFPRNSKAFGPSNESSKLVRARRLQETRSDTRRRRSFPKAFPKGFQEACTIKKKEEEGRGIAVTWRRNALT